MGELGIAPMGRSGEVGRTCAMPIPLPFLNGERDDVNERRPSSTTFPIGFLRSYVYWGCGSCADADRLDAGENCGVEWLPRRMIDGRALELEARFEIACVRGSTNTSAVSTDSLRAVRGCGDWASDEERGGGWNWVLLALLSPSEERSPSSESLSSDVSRSSMAFWIVVGIRSKKSVGDAGAGAEWMTGGRILVGIVKESGLPNPRRAAIGTVGEAEVDAEENEKSADASCAGLMSSTTAEPEERGLRLFNDRVSNADGEG